MNAIPTYGMCAFVTKTDSLNEVFIKSKEDPSASLFIRKFDPYAEEYAKIYSPHKHDFYHFSFYVRGSGSYTIDFVKFDLLDGQAFFMVPGQVHNYEVDDNTCFYVVNFTESYFRSFLRDGLYFERFRFFSGRAEDGIVQLSEELRNKVAVLLDNMIREGIQGKMNSDLIKLWMLEALMLIADECQRKNGVHKADRKSSVLISGFKKLVDENFVKLGLPKEYAALLFVTPSYLNQVSKRITGKTAGEVIRERKLLEAKRMLINQDLHISQIANDLNFTDPSHFSKFFKKHTGKSPDEFRKRAFER